MEEREGGIFTGGAVWCTCLSPLVVLLLGPHHSVVVGACCHLVIVLGCLSWLWAVVAVAGSVSWALHHRLGVHIRGRLLVVIGVHAYGRLVVVVGVHVHERFVVVVGTMLFVVCSSWNGYSLLFVFVGSCWLLLEVVIVGGHRHLLLLALVVVRGLT